MEKASLECIRRLLEITEGERNHDLLLYVKNLRELGASPFPYVVPIIPRLLLVELVKLMEWGRPLVDMLASSLDEDQSIIDR